MNARPEAWLRQARNDLALATLAPDNGFLAQACYYASQAAGKALKGALLELRIEPPHTHRPGCGRPEQPAAPQSEPNGDPIA